MLPISSLLNTLPSLFFQPSQTNKVQEATRPIFRMIASLFSHLAAVGYLIACTIAIGGFTKLSFVIALLSTSTLIGSYVSSYCQTQQSLEDSVNKFEKENNRLQQEVDRLALNNAKLEETNTKLNAEVNRFHEENERLSCHIDRLAGIRIELEQQVTKLEIANNELRAHLATFEKQNAEYQQLIQTDTAAREDLLSKNREQTERYEELNRKNTEQVQHYEQLIKHLEAHVHASSALWEKIHTEANETRESLMNEWQQQLIKSASLIGRMEELARVHEEIRKATANLLELQEKVGVAMQTLGTYNGQIEARDQFLQKIKQDIQDLLEELRVYDKERFDLFFKRLSTLS